MSAPERIAEPVTDCNRNEGGADIEALPAAWRWEWKRQVFRDRTLPSRAKAVADVLAGLMNAKHGDAAWPSREALAEAAGTSVATVKRAITDLRRAGWIAVRKAKFQGPNTYRMTNPEVQKRAPNRLTCDPPIGSPVSRNLSTDKFTPSSSPGGPASIPSGSEEAGASLRSAPAEAYPRESTAETVPVAGEDVPDDGRGKEERPMQHRYSAMELSPKPPSPPAKAETPQPVETEADSESPTPQAPEQAESPAARACEATSSADEIRPHLPPGLHPPRENPAPDLRAILRRAYPVDDIMAALGFKGRLKLSQEHHRGTLTAAGILSAFGEVRAAA